MCSSQTEFSVSEQNFVIKIANERRIVSISLSVEVIAKNEPYFLEIFVVTEGDYLWNTLVEGPSSEKEYRDLSLCIEHLKKAANVFSKENSKVLSFNSLKKAYRYGEKHCKHPIVLK